MGETAGVHIDDIKNDVPIQRALIKRGLESDIPSH